MEKKQFSHLPLHVGIIMDGNGRWAKKRGLPREKGHIEGAKVFRRIGEYAGDLGIKHLTFYAFSTENRSRPENEVNAIMRLLSEYLDEARDRLEENLRKGIRLRFFGDKAALSGDLVSKMDFLEAATADRDRVNLNIAVNYGGQQEILHAVRLLAKEAERGEISPEKITLKDIENRLYSAGQPPADLIIRPSGEQRLSNFLLWQSAYAEFWYSDVLWPDFTTDDFDKALAAYAARNRRFGKV